MNTEDYKMDIFDSEDVELNFDATPPGMGFGDNDNEAVGEEKEIEAQEEGEEPTEEQEDITSEDQEGSEEVTSEDQEEGEEDQEDEDDSSSTDSSALYSSFASLLNEKGLLPSLDLENNEIKDVDGLAASIKSEIDNQSKSYLIDKIGENGYEALERGVSLTEYQNYQDTVGTLDSITEENLTGDLELAKNIIIQDYVSQGMSEDRALRILSKSIELGDDIVVEDAKESLGSLREINKVKMDRLKETRSQEVAQHRELQEKIDNDLKNTVYSDKEIIKGFKPTKAMKDSVYSSMTQIVSTSPDGVPENKLMRQRRDNPIDFDSKLYYVYELTNGFTDFKKLINTSSSKAVSELEKNLRKTKFEGSGAPAYTQDPDSYGGVGYDSELVI